MSGFITLREQLSPAVVEGILHAFVLSDMKITFDVDEFTRRLGYNNRATATTRFGQMKRSLQEANSKIVDANNGVVKPTQTKKRGAAGGSGAKPRAKRAKKEPGEKETDELDHEHLEEKDGFLLKSEENDRFLFKAEE